METEILTFKGTEIEKNKFYSNKTPFLKDIGIKKVLVYNKISFGKKIYNYFIG